MPRTEAQKVSDLSRRLVRVGERLKSDFNAIAAALDLTSLQARTLIALEQPRAMHALAQAMGCEASNITGLADRLERRGLVERIADDTDRRVKLLTLTPDGLEAPAGDDRRDRPRVEGDGPAHQVRAG